MPRARRSCAPNSFFAQARGAELTNAIAKRRGARRDATLLARDEDDRGIGTPRGVPPRGGGMEHRDGAARDGAARDEKNAGRRDVDAPSAGGLERDRDGGASDNQDRQPETRTDEEAAAAADRAAFERMTVAELKDLLRARGQRVGGKKAELVERATSPDIIRRRGVLHVHRGVARSIVVIVRIDRREEETEIPAADGVGGDRPTPPPARPQTRQGDPTIHHCALLERQLNPRAARERPRRPRQPRRERRRGRGGAAGDQAADKERPGAGRQGAGELPAPSVELLDEKARVLGHRSVRQTTNR